MWRFKKQITYPNVTKPHRIFDKSSYFREVNLKNSTSKTNNIQHTKTPDIDLYKLSGEI